MRRVLLAVVTVALLTGCAAWKKGETRVPATAAEKSAPARPESSTSSAGFVERYAGSRKLAHAVELLGKGDQAAAIKELDALCSGKAMPGVSDEALFRLALLSLKSSGEKPAPAQLLLKRLRKEYPASSWTVQAAPVLDLLNQADDLKQQNRNLKTASQSLARENQSLTRENQSLSREISDLNKSINQLKKLDLELEQKRR